MIKKLAHRGGVMGLNFYSCFLNNNATDDDMSKMDDMINHIKHIKNIGGIEVIGLGSDFDGIDCKVEIENASKMQILAEKMKKEGFTEKEVEHIFYKNVLNLFKSIGAEFSIGCPSFQKITDTLYYLTVNHEYKKRADSEEDITAATIHARAEINKLVKTLREKGGPAFRNISLAVTPEMIGVREGRRIHGMYTISLEDVLTGRQHEDAVCLVTYWVDIHNLLPNGGQGYENTGIDAKPYHIPFRSLLPKDCDNLLLAGRSISGDFYAHASYRVAGNMAAVGEAAGMMAAIAAQKKVDIKTLRYQDYRVLPVSDR